MTFVFSSISAISSHIKTSAETAEVFKVFQAFSLAFRQAPTGIKGQIFSYIQPYACFKGFTASVGLRVPSDQGITGPCYPRLVCGLYRIKRTVRQTTVNKLTGPSVGNISDCKCFIGWYPEYLQPPCAAAAGAAGDVGMFI